MAVTASVTRLSRPASLRRRRTQLQRRRRLLPTLRQAQLTRQDSSSTTHRRNPRILRHSRVTPRHRVTPRPSRAIPRPSRQATHLSSNPILSRSPMRVVQSTRLQVRRTTKRLDMVHSQPHTQLRIHRPRRLSTTIRRRNASTDTLAVWRETRVVHVEGCSVRCMRCLR